MEFQLKLSVSEAVELIKETTPTVNNGLEPLLSKIDFNRMPQSGKI